MTLAEHIVGVILDDEATPQVIDPRQHPDLYSLKYSENGRDVFVTCMNCEQNRFPYQRRYVPGTGVSHGLCQNHMDELTDQLRT